MVEKGPILEVEVRVHDAMLMQPVLVLVAVALYGARSGLWHTGV